MSNLSTPYKPRILGRSGLNVGPIGFGSSYGAPAAAYEKGFEHGCNYFYWGSYRRKGMGDAIRHLAPRHRDQMVVVLQSYARIPALLKMGLHRGLRSLKLEQADVLLLGWYNEMPSEHLMETVEKLRGQGLFKKLAISCHERPQFEFFIKDRRFDIIMTRYNAAHRGAEREVFPHLPEVKDKPGVVTYTTTRWGYLINPKYTPPGVKTPTAKDCYRFALSNPTVDLCLSGPASLEQMEDNLKAIELGPLSSDEIVWMKKVGDHVHKLTSKKLWTNPFMQRKQ